MATVPHPVPSRTAHAIAALYGVEDDTLVAWQRFCAQTAETLRQQHDAERLSKALALAQGGAFEWTHTMRASADTELHTRVQAFVPTFREVVAALDALQAEREAAHAAPVPPPPAPATPTPPPASAPPDLQALLQQALQHALSGQVANGQAPGTPAPTAPSNGQRQAKAKTGDQATGFCSLHNVAMEHRENERGSWYSHWLPEDERHCKGRR